MADGCGLSMNPYYDFLCLFKLMYEGIKAESASYRGRITLCVDPCDTFCSTAHDIIIQTIAYRDNFDRWGCCIPATNPVQTFR